MKSSFERITASLYPFAVIVRTQGKRQTSLAESLQSISFQKLKCLAVIVVHTSDDEILKQVSDVCREINNLDYVIVIAKDTTKHVGYPLNLGLKYCYTSQLKIEFICFLDDDDILYPFFTQKMYQAFATTQADVVYASSNRRHLGSPPEEGYRPKHIFHLFIENFIPVNSCAIRLKPLQEHPVFTDEEIKRTEDWLFLLRLLENGFRFEPVEDTVSEFRYTSGSLSEVLNGSMVQSSMKTKYDAWKQSSLQIRAYINKANFSINGYVLASAVMSIDPKLSVLSGGKRPEDAGSLMFWMAGCQIKCQGISYLRKARWIWDKMPLRVKVALKKSYKNLGRAIDEFRE